MSTSFGRWMTSLKSLACRVMPMPNMMMPRSVTVWGTDHKNAPGMK